VATNPIGGSGWNFLYAIGLGLGGNLGILSGSTISMTGIPRPLYHYSLPLYGLLTLALYALSTHLILPTQRWKLRRREVLVSLGVLLLLVGVIAGLFLLTTDRYEGSSIFAVPTPPMVRGAIAMPAPIQEQVAVEVVIGESPPAPPEMVLDDMPVDDPSAAAIDIYSAVVRQFYYVDHIYGRDMEPPLFPALHLFSFTDDGAGDPKFSYLEQPVTIPESVQQGILDSLTGPAAEEAGQILPAQVFWVNIADTGKFSTAGSFENGALIIFGNIHFTSSEMALVSAAIHSSEGARGKAFRLSLDDGTWKISGDTGSEWMR
jgi:hypothetical protein